MPHILWKFPLSGFDSQAEKFALHKMSPIDFFPDFRREISDPEFGSRFQVGISNSQCAAQHSCQRSAQRAHVQTVCGTDHTVPCELRAAHTACITLQSEQQQTDP